MEKTIVILTLIGILGALNTLLLLMQSVAVKKPNQQKAYFDDCSPRKFYITGDKHRNFTGVIQFCSDMNTRRKDVLIILGDSGFNYFMDTRDEQLKEEVSRINITLFCLYGNKECRPENVGGYGIRNFCGGKVYYEPRYPNIYFAIDGEIYTFEGKKYMVVGGAHSVDKVYCLSEGVPFWEDEMPDDNIRARVESRLADEGNTIYGIMTHTCPIAYLPTEMFISTRRNDENKKMPDGDDKVFKPDIDRSTEEWLGKIENKISYQVWYCGHYHVDKQLDRIRMMCNKIRPLHMDECGDYDE